MRGASQTISYEIVLIFVSLFPLCLCSSFFLHSFLIYKFFFGFWLFSLFFMWLVRAVAETNRSPFDFSEGERELVSGFNVEYGSMGFACLFLGEYGQIIFLRFLRVLLFLSLGWDRLKFVIGVFIALFFIVFRSTYPRYRYDLLMELAWCYCLLFFLSFFFYLFSFSVF